MVVATFHIQGLYLTPKLPLLSLCFPVTFLFPLLDANFDEVLPANVFRIFGNEFADFDEVLPSRQTFSAFLAMNSPTLMRFSLQTFSALFGDKSGDKSADFRREDLLVFGGEIVDFVEALPANVHFSGDPSLPRPSLNNSAAADTSSRQRVVECQ